MPTTSNAESWFEGRPLSQFQRPWGVVGRLAGWIMRVQNGVMNRAAVEALAVGGDDDVLEIGFGPGNALVRLVQRTPARSITGLDPSTEMIEEAGARLAAPIEEGRVRLVQGTACHLPFEAQQFSRVLAVSTFHDWENRSQGVGEVRRVLRAGGRLVLCLRRAARHRLPWSAPGVSPRELADDEQLLLRQGFANVRCLGRRFHPRIVCLVAGS